MGQSPKGLEGAVHAQIPAIDTPLVSQQQDFELELL